MRMARSAVAAGWHATIYSRLEPGHPDVEERDGYLLVRVPADWRRAVPGLRWAARRRARAALREARTLRHRPVDEPVPAGDIDDHDTSSEREEPTPSSGLGGDEGPPAAKRSLPRRLLRAPIRFARRATRRTGRRVRRWRRHLVAFPLRPLGWAVALDEQVEAADVWHGMWIGSLPALDRLRRRKGGRTIYDSRDIYMLARDRQQLERPLRRLLASLERRWAQRADLVLTVNEPYADLLVRQLGVARPPVVMNCPDVWLAPSADPDRIRRALGLDPATAVALYQGQLITERGIEQALEAILDVPDTVLVLLGYGPMEAKLRARAAQPPYRGKVYVLPAVPPDDLLEWTASADVTVIPIQPTTVNHRYSTPQKLFESLAAGVPVVASDLPGMAEVVRSTGAGVLCDPTSPAAIAAALRTVISAPAAERTALRARVRTAAGSRYNWPAQALVLLGIYDQLLGRRLPPRQSPDALY
jgi:glycosyltransferase involved in cell wall biosynthesis